jgi:hypothetical protein
MSEEVLVEQKSELVSSLPDYEMSLAMISYLPSLEWITCLKTRWKWSTMPIRPPVVRN